jgi:PGF-pre-PGF domain-containing protein
LDNNLFIMLFAKLLMKKKSWMDAFLLVFICLSIFAIFIFVEGPEFVSGAASNNTTTEVLQHLWIRGDSIYSFAQDSNNSLIYLAGSRGLFGFYNLTSRTFEDLRGTDAGGWFDNAVIGAAAYDTNNNLVYLSGEGTIVPFFGVYDAGNNESYDLSQTDTDDWMSSFVTAVEEMSYDSANDLLYLVGVNGLFGVYNITDNTTYSLMGTDTDDWINDTDLYGSGYDSENNLVYFTGGEGLFGFYNITSNVTYDLNGTDPGNWIGSDSSYTLLDVIYNQDNGLVYLAGFNGLFGAYNISDNTTYDLSGTDPGNWMSGGGISTLSYDSSNNLIYFVGDNKLFGAYNISDNTTYDLRAATDSEVIDNTLKSVAVDSNNGLAYLGGYTGTIGYYNKTSNTYTDLNLPNDWVRFNTLSALASDEDNNMVYFSGGSDFFGVYNITVDEKKDLRGTDVGGWISQRELVSVLSVDGKTYLGGYNGVIFGVYNTTDNLTYDLRTTFLSAGWTSSPYYGVLDLAYDSNDLIYLGGGAGLFGAYNITANTVSDLTTTDDGDWVNATDILSVAYNADNELIFFGGDGGLFGYYDKTENESYNLSNTVSDDWIGTYDVQSMVFDSTNNRIYLAAGDFSGFSGSKFGFYDVENNITHDLSDTVPSGWLTNNVIYDLAYDSVNELVYLVGGGLTTSRFGVYNKTSNLTEDLAATDTDDWIGNTLLNAVTFHSNENLTYLAGYFGVFGYYNRSSNATEIAAPIVGVPAAVSESGGGLRTQPVIASQTFLIPSASGGGSASAVITDPKIDIRNITIFPKEDIKDASLIVEQGFPTESLKNFAVPFGTFYQAFSITAKAIENEKLNNVTLEFRVNKTWLAEQNYSYDNVALYRVQNETSPWQVLPTVSIQEDLTYYYFSAASPGFSTFVVVASEKTLKCTPLQTRCFNNEVQMCDKNSEWIATETCSEACQNGKCVSGQKTKVVFYSIIILGISAAIIFVILGIFKKRKQNK